MFSDHNRVKLEVTNKKIARKSSNTWKLSNTFPKNSELKERVSREIKKFIKLNANENTTNTN